MVLAWAAATCGWAQGRDAAAAEGPAAGAPAEAATAAEAGGADLVTRAKVLLPTSWFLQWGDSDEGDNTMATAGLIWEWGRPLSLGPFEFEGYWEVSFGRWSAHPEGERSTAWVSHIGITPTLRHWFGEKRTWFVEGGIGINFIAPIYETHGKRFSTVFNFGDHLAVGRRFGADGGHELALRFQHFSNAGVRQPNPGENFLQVRYVRRWP